MLRLYAADKVACISLVRLNIGGEVIETIFDKQLSVGISNLNIQAARTTPEDSKRKKTPTTNIRTKAPGLSKPE